MKLSENFNLDEFLKSDTAIRLNIENIPNQFVIDNLTLLSINILEKIRYNFKKPIKINSGFRCLELNRAIKSSDNSQHTKGEAADIEIDGVDNYDLAIWVRDNLDFDQLILEFYTGEPHSGWVHISYIGINNRKQCLTINKNGTKQGLIKNP